MKLIRKALWPTAIVAAVLMLFGALGSAVNADDIDGDVRSSSGSSDVIDSDKETAIYVVVDFDADADNDGKVDLSAEQVAANALKVTLDDAVDAMAAATTTLEVDRADRTLRTALLAAEIDLATTDVEGVQVLDVPLALSMDEDKAGGLVTLLNTAVDTYNTGEASLAEEDAVTSAADNVKARVTAETDPAVAFAEVGEYTVELDGADAEITAVFADGELVAQRAGRSSADVVPALLTSATAGSDNLVDFDLPEDRYVVLVMVECTAGEFDVSFDSDSASGVGTSATFECRGSVDGAGIDASESSVETIGSSTGSVITVTTEGADGEAAIPGNYVYFTTDNCEFEEANRRTKGAVRIRSVANGDDTVAEATLDCSQRETAIVGTATIVAVVDKDGRDVVLTTTVNVVGPPDSLTVDAASMMDAMPCGEVAKLTITVVDSAGQPVANGTTVIVSTNYGGVLASPTALAPTSTVATTSGGAATVYLITSDTHVGDYALVVTAGSAVGYATVTCGIEMEMGADADADAPAITPPSTGNAGLAETSGSSWMLLVIAGALVSVMVAVGKGMPSFFRR